MLKDIFNALLNNQEDNNPFNKPIAPTPLDPYKEEDPTLVGVDGMSAARNANKSVDSARRDLLNSAVRRNQQRLGYEVENNDRSAAYRDSIRGYKLYGDTDVGVSKLPSQERIANYINGSTQDPELDYAIQNYSDGELRVKYGDSVANYAREKRERNIANLQATSGYMPEDQDTSSIFSGLAGGVSKGAGSIYDTARIGSAFLFDDARERNVHLQQINKDSEIRNRGIARFQGSGYALNDEKVSMAQNIAESNRLDNYKSIYANTGNKEYAQKESDRIAENTNSLLSPINSEELISGIGEQAPQLLLGIGSSGIGNAVGAGARKLAYSAARKLGASAARKAIASQLGKEAFSIAGTALGGGISAGVQDGASAAADASTAVYDWFDNLSDSAKSKWLSENPVAQQIRAENPNATPEDILSQVASTAATEAGLKSGLYTAASASIPSLLEYRALAPKSIFAKAGEKVAGANRLSRILGGVAEIPAEGLSEAGEEYINAISPKTAVNNATGETVYDNPSRYAKEQALHAGAVAMASSGATNPIGMTAQAGKGTYDAAKAFLEKVATKGKDKLEAVADKVKGKESKDTSDVTAPFTTPQDSKINVLGTNGDEPIDGVLGNNLTNSNFGRALAEVKGVIDETNETSLKNQDKSNYGANIVNYVNHINDMEKYYDENKDSLPQDEADAISELIGIGSEVKGILKDAIHQDIAEFSPKHGEAIETINELSNIKNTIETKLANGEISEEKGKELLDKVQNKFTATIKDLESLGQTTDRVNALLESNLYSAIISTKDTEEIDPENTRTLKVAEAKFARISSLNDILFSKSSNINSSANSIATSIKDAKSESLANNIIKAWSSKVSALSNDLLKKENRSNIKENFGKIKDTFNNLIDTAKEKNFAINPMLQLLSDEINKVDLENSSDTKVKVFADKFLGSRGLFSLAKSKNYSEALKQLSSFSKSQNNKLTALAKLAFTHNEDYGNFETPITDIVVDPTANDPKKKYLYKEGGKGKVEFANSKALHSYYNTVANESTAFNQLRKAIVEKATESMKPASVKQKAEKVPTKGAKQVTKQPLEISKEVQQAIDETSKANVTKQLDQKNAIEDTVKSKPATSKEAVKKEPTKVTDKVKNKQESKEEVASQPKIKDKAKDIVKVEENADVDKSPEAVNTVTEEPSKEEKIEHAPIAKTINRLADAYEESLPEYDIPEASPDDYEEYAANASEYDTEDIASSIIDESTFNPFANLSVTNDVNPIVNFDEEDFTKVMANGLDKESSDTARKIIVNNIPKLFAQAAKIASDKKSKYSKRTIDTWGLLDSVLPEYGVSQKTLDNMHKFGFSMKSNLVQDNCEINSKKLIGLQKLDNALTNVKEIIGNKNLENKSQKVKDAIKEFSKIYNGSLTDEDLDFLSSDDNIEDTVNTISAFSKIYDYVQNYFAKYSPAALADNAEDMVIELSSINGFTNFIGIADPENKSVSVTTHLVAGIAKAIHLQLAKKMQIGNSDGDALVDRFNTMLGDDSVFNNDFKIYSTTPKTVVTVGTNGKSIRSVEAIAKKLYGDESKASYNPALVQESKLVKGIRVSNGEESLEDVSNLGTKRDEFVNQLGEEFYKAMGIKFNQDTPANIKDGLLQSAGIELANLLLVGQALDTFQVNLDKSLEETVDDEGNIISPRDNKNILKLYYVNLVTNNTNNTYSHLPQHVHKYMTASLMQAKGTLPYGTDLEYSKNQYLAYTDQADSNGYDFSLLPSLIEVAQTHNTAASNLLTTANKNRDDVSIFNKNELSKDTAYKKATTNSIKNPIVSNLPPKLEEGINEHNKVPYQLDKHLLKYAINPDLTEALEEVAGLIPKSELKQMLPIAREAAESRNNNITRGIAVIKEMHKLAMDTVGNADDAVFFFRNKATQVQRIMQEFGTSPQANKLVRELLKTANNIEAIDEDKLQQLSKEVGIDLAKEYEPYKKALTEGMKLPKAENKIRDIDFLINSTAANIDKTSPEYLIQKGLVLSLAQALGIKLEKRTDESIYKELSELFNNNKYAYLNELADTLFDIDSSESPTISKEQKALFTKLGKDFDGSSIRAFSVLRAFGEYKHGKNNATFNHHNYLEADGISNGMANIISQFSSNISESIPALEKVGVTTMAGLLQYISTTPNPELNDFSNHSGSATVFDPANPNRINDTYETVSNTMATRLLENIDNINNDDVKHTLDIVAKSVFKKPLADVSIMEFTGKFGKAIGKDILYNIQDIANDSGNPSITFPASEIEDMLSGIYTLAHMSILDVANLFGKDKIKTDVKNITFGNFLNTAITTKDGKNITQPS